MIGQAQGTVSQRGFRWEGEDSTLEAVDGDNILRVKYD